MTIEERMKQNMHECGMWEEQAQAVIDQMKAAERPLMEAHVWRDKVDDYPARYAGGLVDESRTRGPQVD